MVFSMGIEFVKMEGISQNISLDCTMGICDTLDCKIDDILEFISEEKEK